MDRRDFIKHAAASSISLGVLTGGMTVADYSSNSEVKVKLTPKKENRMTQIIIAADPFAVTLKDSVIAYLKEKGYDVVDVGATTEKEVPYYEGCVTACKLLQKNKDARGILFCGTGMGMSVIANRFEGITAAVVESVFAAGMCRSINDANVLCLGAMIWGEWMAKEAVTVFLNTKFTQGLDGLADFLKDAKKKVDAIRDK